MAWILVVCFASCQDPIYVLFPDRSSCQEERRVALSRGADIAACLERDQHINEEPKHEPQN